MAAQEGPKRKTPAEKPEQSKAAIEKAKAEAEAALTRAEHEEKARLKAEEALAEAQEALAATRSKVEEECLARAKAEQARADAETALAETRKAIGVEAENTKAPLTAPGEEGEQRISFVVRVTVDERGQPRRTEVEHAQSGKKETFPALDARRLAAFMGMCINPPVTPEPTAPPVPSPVTKETPTPGPLGPASGLTVSDVRVFHKATPGDTALMLNADEAFEVQVRFQVHGPEAASLTVQGSSFDMRVYTREVTSGRSTLLITYSENLVENVLEYKPQRLVPGLPPGLYRLVTLVSLQAPTKMVSHYDGPIVQVAAVQPSVNPAAPLEVPLSQ